MIMAFNFGLALKVIFTILKRGMYVCVCYAVTDTEVQSAIQGGCTSREAVTRACRAGGDCGSCHGMIDSMLEDAAEGGGPELVAAGALVRTTRAA